ncbi:peptide-methionine (S)-S-oxide reductase MsrA [Pseudomonas sp. sp1636]|uniref:peptide-methionine (S)-S-oxide reductase MsrA n=1 Tax=Pseudomonas sp. sp1636 TaxID=3036707 RepID=UPI0025A549D9|nr:peptide-methionine (S)-S-oxide reductase MsrA [Pseudomonas sp. sp1636]MDM8349406.1 peptide-methionine (S)-S-oxide reductase MsrA [Pseudomonas sp. sp1636]
MPIHQFAHFKRAPFVAAGLLFGALLAVCGATTAQAAKALTHANEGQAEQAVAVFAGGCFWCTEADFDKLPGVLSTTSGYIGGSLENPSYEQVSAGGSGHIEAVQVHFDPRKTSYAKLLEAYWPTIDPLTPNAQFCDHGSQYRSAIFYSTPEEKAQADASKAALQASGRFQQPIVTELLPATTFYPAEGYHQDYHQKNPLRYAYYRNGCGRDKRLEQLWGKQR